MTIYGNDGAGVYYINKMAGVGDENDTYHVDNYKDTVTEKPGGGIDTIIIDSDYLTTSGKPFTIANNVEDLYMTQFDITDFVRKYTTNPSATLDYLGKNRININGNSSNNQITMNDSSGSYMKVFAGIGDDTIIGASDIINGNDSIDGGAGKDLIYGCDGNDTISGGADTDLDSLFGGLGNDTYLIKDANDYISDSSGANTLKLDKFYTGNAVDLNSAAFKYGGIATVDASDVKTALTITGTSSNTIFGGSGNDTIIAGAGVNHLHGNNGNDTFVVDGSGDLSPTSGMELDGGKGIDTIKAISHATDGYFYYDKNDGNGYIAQSTFNASIKDAITVENLDCHELNKTALNMTGNTLANYIKGGELDDTIDGALGADTMAGGNGNDTYYVDNAKDKIIEAIHTEGINDRSDKAILTAAVSYKLADNVEEFDLSKVTFAANAKKLGLTETANGLDNNITVDGSASYMKIIAGAGNDTINSGNGNGYIDGGLGDDSITAGNGNNKIIAGDGENHIQLGDGNNTVTGGAGVDAIVTGAGNSFVNAGNGDNFVKVGVGNSTITSGTGNDTLESHDGNMIINAGNGNNWIYTAIGNNKITTGTGNDYIDADDKNNITSAAGKDTITSGAGNDTIYGRGGNDIIDGGAGNDIIQGDAGNDTLTGGLGNDTYNFFSGDGKDIIKATDKYDLINIFTNNNVTKDDLLFYKDKKGNLYIDYTENDSNPVGVGVDVITIAKGKCDGNTTVQVGNDTIHINDIISQLSKAGTSLEAAGNAINLQTENAQSAILHWAPSSVT